MPALIRLYIRQTLAGFAASIGFVTLLLWFDVAGLWHLVTHSPGGYLAVAMLVFFNGLVFAGVQFGIAIMRMADKDDPGGGSRRPLPVMHPDQPVPVRVIARHRSG